ncbi:MAG: ABC transporter permease [Erysipelotrichaceae bacterium]|nr:ABC transporter permease [Erysipelotrichaceae bacterium]MDY6034753.1 ABC transporter permease [Bulleidia sp.]
MANLFQQLLNASFIFIVIRVGAPLVYASLSSYVSSLAGIPNIAIEGVMNFAALFGVYFSAITGSAWIGLLGAIGIGVVCGLVLAFFTIKMKASPIMVGIALNLFSADFAIYLLLLWTGSKGTTASLPSKVLPTINIPFIEKIPFLGSILSGHYFLTYVCVLITILLFILVYKTPFGLRMKACGLDEHAAESVGIKVNRVRTIAAVLSCVLAALGGAYLSMGYMSFYSSNMIASRGWIGIAAAAVGGNNLGVVILVTMIFAVAQAVVNVLLLEGLPSELVNIIPYVSVLVILIIIGISTKKQLASVKTK